MSPGQDRTPGDEKQGVMIGHKDRKTKEAENGEREVSWGKDRGGLSGEGDMSALKGTKDKFMP